MLEDLAILSSATRPVIVGSCKAAHHSFLTPQIAGKRYQEAKLLFSLHRQECLTQMNSHSVQQQPFSTLQDTLTFQLSSGT